MSLGLLHRGSLGERIFFVDNIKIQIYISQKRFLYYFDGLGLNNTASTALVLVGGIYTFYSLHLHLHKWFNNNAEMHF